MNFPYFRDNVMKTIDCGGSYDIYRILRIVYFLHIFQFELELIEYDLRRI